MANLPTASTINNALIELGLGQNEALLYEILLKNTDTTIPFLVSKTNLGRTLLYYVLKNLMDFELAVMSKKDKKTVYNAVAPDKLEDFLHDQEKELQKQKNTLKDVMSDISSMYRLSHNKPGVRFYEGAEGFKEALLDSLNATGIIYTFADAENVEKYVKTINQEYVKMRLEKKIPKKIIAVDSPFAREHYKNITNPLTEVRLITQNINPFKTGVQIYNNKVSFATLTDKKMIGVIIEDENISETHRSLFEYIWNTLPPLGAQNNNITRPNAPPSGGPAVVLNP